MKVQEIFQGTFKLISSVGPILYMRRQTIEHLCKWSLYVSICFCFEL